MKAADQIQLFKVQSESTALCRSVMQPVTADDWFNKHTSFSLKKTIKLLQMHYFIRLLQFSNTHLHYLSCDFYSQWRFKEKSVDRIALKFFQFEKIMSHMFILPFLGFIRTLIFSDLWTLPFQLFDSVC